LSQFSGCNLLMRAAVQVAHVCPLQGSRKPYREFESLSLRQTVWTPEKSGCLVPKIAQNRRNSSTFALKQDRRCAFLWRPDTQSGFNDSIRRMQCDHKPMI
jgi:hypothetical protein